MHRLCLGASEPAPAPHADRVQGRLNRRSAAPADCLTTDAGPDDPLVHLRHGTDTLVDELLNALSLVGLRRVDVALGIGSDTVDGEELPWLTTAIAEHREDLERLAIHHIDALVPAVGEEDVLLLGVA